VDPDRVVEVQGSSGGPGAGGHIRDRWQVSRFRRKSSGGLLPFLGKVCRSSRAPALCMWHLEKVRGCQTLANFLLNNILLSFYKRKHLHQMHYRGLLEI